MTTMLLSIWFALLGLLLVLECLLLLRQQWSRLTRKVSCPWCWKRWHLMRWYPRRLSSSICCAHERLLRKQSAARRARRLAQMGG